MHWIGACTDTSIVICYRAVANAAAVYVTIGDTTTATQTSDTSVDDGVLRFEAFALAVGTTYDYSIFEAGAVVGTGQCYTLPAAGEEWAICYLSCWGAHNDAGLWIKERLDAYYPPVKIVIFQGDTPYTNSPSGGADQVFWGETITNCDTAIDALITAKGLGVAGYDYTDATNKADVRAVMDTTHRVFRTCPGVKAIIENYSTLWQASDHEYPGNDVERNDITTINNTKTLVATNDQLDDLMTICRDSYNGYHKGNPGNAEADADSGFSRYYQSYWRLHCNDDLDIISVDTYWVRDQQPVAIADRPLFGTTQLSWLAATIPAQPTKYNIVTSPSPMLAIEAWAEETGPHPQTADGGDNGERDLLIKELANHTGTVLISGDVHHSFYSTHNGITCFCISPVSATQNTGTADNKKYDTGARWWNNGLTNGANDFDGSWQGQLGFVDIGADAMTMRAYLGRNGYRTFGTIPVGSNTLTPVAVVSSA